MATKKLQDLTASTSPGDADIMLIEDTTATKKITFLNLFNRIKTKLGLATVATSGKLADTVKDEDNRTITDAERAKWNGYGNDLASLNSNMEAANSKYAYNTKAYDANILTFAESLADGTFCVMQYTGYSSSGTPINAAPSNSSGVAYIAKNNANYITILAIPYVGGKYTRTKNNGTWRAWE